MQLGLVSLGPSRCGHAVQPALYTKISHFTNWIYDHLRLWINHNFWIIVFSVVNQMEQAKYILQCFTICWFKIIINWYHFVNFCAQSTLCDNVILLADGIDVLK